MTKIALFRRNGLEDLNFVPEFQIRAKYKFFYERSE